MKVEKDGPCRGVEVGKKPEVRISKTTLVVVKLTRCHEICSYFKKLHLVKLVISKCILAIKNTFEDTLTY